MGIIEIIRTLANNPNVIDDEFGQEELKKYLTDPTVIQSQKAINKLEAKYVVEVSSKKGKNKTSTASSGTSISQTKLEVDRERKKDGEER